MVASLAARLPALLAPDGVYLTTQNGVPWWYLQRNPRAPGTLRDICVDAVDPGGSLCDTLDSARLIAAVTYPVVHIGEPGSIQHASSLRIPLGELDGLVTPRVQELSDVL